MQKIIFHGSRDYFENILLYKCCDIGFHCGTLEQALYRVLDYGKCPTETFFNSYVYEISLDINDKQTIELPDCISWADTETVKEKIREKYPYLNIEPFNSIIELREYFLKMDIKYITYKNEIEGKGYSYILLDENDEAFTLKRYTIREIINKIDYGKN